MTMPESKTHWLDSSKNVTMLYRGLWIVCAALFAADLFLHRHEDFSFATLFGFHSLYGFLACAVIVLAAKQLRRVLMRDEDYYER
jgi:DNA phosphorothioation-dependent restriction protein DptG